MATTPGLIAAYLAGSVLLCWIVRRWQSQPRLPVCALYVLLAAVFFANSLFSGGHQIATDIVYQERPFSSMVDPAAGEPLTASNPLLVDPPLMILPFRKLVRDSLLAGELPLWTHRLGAGQPLLGNGQSAAFGPLQLLSLPAKPLHGMALVAAWQMLLCLLFVHALVRRLEASEWAAAFSAIAFAWSSFQVFWAFYPLATTATFLPAIALGVLSAAACQTRTDARRQTLWLAGMASALLLSGHPETAVHALLLAVFVTVAELRRSRCARQRARLISTLAAAALLSALITAPVLVASTEALFQSERFAQTSADPERVQPPDLALESLLLIANPLTFGSPRDANYRGPWNLNEAAAWAGLMTLVLASAGVLLDSRIRWLMAGGALCLITALRVPLVGDLVAQLPLIGQVPNGRLRVLFLLALSVSAGLAFDKILVRRAAGRRGARLATASSAVLFVGVFWALGVPSVPVQRLWFWLTLGSCSAVLLWLLVLPRSRKASRALAMAVVATLAVDLFVLGARYNPTLGPELDLSRRPEATAYLEQRAVESPHPFRVLAEGYEMYPNTSALFGLNDVRTLDPAQPALPARFLEQRLAGGAGPFAPWLFIEPGDFDAELDSYLGVRYRLTPHRRNLPEPWRLAFRGGGGKVWQLETDTSWFRFPKQVEQVDEIELAWQQVARIESFSETSVIESGKRAPSSAQSGKIVSWRAVANGFELTVDTTTGGFVASSVAWAPGWRAVAADRDRGSALTVARANGAFLAVEVPPGVARIELIYRPRGFRLACLATALGLLVAAALGWMTLGWTALGWTFPGTAGRS